MNDQRPGMFIPALMGGAIAGILTGIPLVNCFCCLWIIGGGVIAAYFLIKESKTVLTSGDGAIVGVFSGIIGALVEFFVSIPMAPVADKFIRTLMDRFTELANEMPEGLERLFDQDSLETSVPMFMLGLVINTVVFSMLGALGGIIGITLFQKNKSQKKQGIIDVPKDHIQTKTSDNNKS